MATGGDSNEVKARNILAEANKKAKPQSGGKFFSGLFG